MSQNFGKFLLLNLAEFEAWLDNFKFTRLIKLIQIHHTLVPAYKDFTGDNHFKLLESMRDYHVNVKKYQDIAQNITILPDGLAAICRNFNTPPAGILGANTYGICIENIGNFDMEQDVITDAQSETIIKTVALLCKRLSLSPSVESVVFHSWYNLDTGIRDNEDGSKTNDKQHKTCPGTGFFAGNTMYDCEHEFLSLIQKELKT